MSKPNYIPREKLAQLTSEAFEEGLPENVLLNYSRGRLRGRVLSADFVAVSGGYRLEDIVTPLVIDGRRAVGQMEVEGTKYDIVVGEDGRVQAFNGTSEPKEIMRTKNPEELARALIY